MRLIDADAAADKIMRETEKRADDLDMIGIALMIGIARMLRDENDFPTIEAEPVRHGRWIPEMNNNDERVYHCSECGCYVTVSFYYCPSCGSKMDGGAGQ